MAGTVKRRGTQRGLSRLEAFAGVVTLVVVVAALFMLKGKFVFDEPDDDAHVESSAGSTPQPGASSTAAAVESTPDLPKRGELHFEAGSAKLPVAAEDTIAPLVKALRSDGLLTAVVVADPAGGSAELARARAGAVGHAFEADGVSAARVLVELAPVRAAKTAASAGSGALRSAPAGGAVSGNVRIELRSR